MEEQRRHGIVIIHGAGRHRELDMLTGFATGFVETVKQMVEEGSVQGIPDLDEFGCRADLEVTHGDNYVDVSLRSPQVVFHIQEAYWQRAFQPHDQLRIMRWLWRVVTTLAGLNRRLPFPAVVMQWAKLAALAVLGVCMDAGLLVGGLWLLRAAGARLSGLVALSESASAVLRLAYPVGVVAVAAALILFAVLALTVLLYIAAVLWRERRFPWQWGEVAPWYMAVPFMGMAIFMWILLLVGMAIRMIPLGFPGKDAIASYWGGLGAWFEQDLFGDTEVFATDEVRAASMRQQLEDRIRSLQQQGFRRIHVVAHSLGSVISFEVFSRTLPASGKDWIRTFFSVGSPLKKFRYLTVEPRPGARLAARLSEVLEWAGERRMPTLLRAPLRWLFRPLIGRLAEWPAFQPAYRFKGQVGPGFPEYFNWRNILADWDAAADRLEKLQPDDPDLGEVEDVPVLSTRRLGAHFAYWDKGCETMRYILEEIEPDLFGDKVHTAARKRKSELLGA